jgi:prepilin peptidase dependent protein B
MLASSMTLRQKGSVTSRRSAAGLSLVEMLVGITIGLFIVSVAAGTFVTNISNTRKLALEARVNQELRTAMDVIARDLRRGAYWGNSLKGTIPVGTTLATTPNPYSTVAATGSTQINYAYTRDTTEDDSLDASAEQFGIKLDTTTHAIQMYIGGSWQALTNSEVVLIPDDGLVITPTETSIDIRRSCATTCNDTIVAPAIPTAAQNCPRVLVRTYNVSLTGVSKSDSGVSRTLQTQVRVRNDGLAGVCPG